MQEQSVRSKIQASIGGFMGSESFRCGDEGESTSSMIGNSDAVLVFDMGRVGCVQAA